MSSPHSIDEAIDWLRKHFEPDPGRELNARFSFDLTGAGGGAIGMQVEAGRLTLSADPEPRPDVRLRLAAGDWFAILAGRENADLLYLAGRLEIDGDLSLAMKLRSLFRSSAS